MARPKGSVNKGKVILDKPFVRKRGRSKPDSDLSIDKLTSGLGMAMGTAVIEEAAPVSKVGLEKLKNIVIKQQDLDTLMASSDIQYFECFETVTIAVVKLPNGYVIVGHAACMDKRVFNSKIGREIALDKVIDQLAALEGYLLLSNDN